MNFRLFNSLACRLMCDQKQGGGESSRRMAWGSRGRERDCARMSPLQRCAAAAEAMLLHCCAAAMLLSAQWISPRAGRSTACAEHTAILTWLSHTFVTGTASTCALARV